MTENVAKKWPELFYGLTSTQAEAIIQAVASGELEGIEADRKTVDLLCRRSRGEISHAQYLEIICCDSPAASTETM